MATLTPSRLGLANLNHQFLTISGFVLMYAGLKMAMIRKSSKSLCDPSNEHLTVTPNECDLNEASMCRGIDHSIAKTLTKKMAIIKKFQ
jgi:hypothetical protein